MKKIIYFVLPCRPTSFLSSDRNCTSILNTMAERSFDDQMQDLVQLLSARDTPRLNSGTEPVGQLARELIMSMSPSDAECIVSVINILRNEPQQQQGLSDLSSADVMRSQPEQRGQPVPQDFQPFSDPGLIEATIQHAVMEQEMQRLLGMQQQQQQRVVVSNSYASNDTHDVYADDAQSALVPRNP